MIKKQNFVILLSVIISLFLFGVVAQTSFAFEVAIIVEPAETTIQMGGEVVALTVEAEGTDLKFSWRLVGVGTLEGQSDGEAVLYVPPKQIEGDSDRAIVSVKVENYRGEEATKSVIFKIISTNNALLPSASSEETVESNGNSIVSATGSCPFDNVHFKKIVVDDEGEIQGGFAPWSYLHGGGPGNKEALKEGSPEYNRVRAIIDQVIHLPIGGIYWHSTGEIFEHGDNDVVNKLYCSEGKEGVYFDEDVLLNVQGTRALGIAVSSGK